MIALLPMPTAVSLIILCGLYIRFYGYWLLSVISFCQELGKSYWIANAQSTIKNRLTNY